MTKLLETCSAHEVVEATSIRVVRGARTARVYIELQPVGPEPVVLQCVQAVIREPSESYADVQAEVCEQALLEPTVICLDVHDVNIRRCGHIELWAEVAAAFDSGLGRVSIAQVDTNAINAQTPASEVATEFHTQILGDEGDCGEVGVVYNVCSPELLDVVVSLQTLCVHVIGRCELTLCARDADGNVLATERQGFLWKGVPLILKDTLCLRASDGVVSLEVRISGEMESRIHLGTVEWSTN